jgi:hypothetical protein
MNLRTSCGAALIALALSLALTSAATAETPAESGGRYTMSPVDGGFLRLDKQTGAVAMCARSGSEWACKAVEDQTTTAASPDELSRLQHENKELKDRVKALEDSLETEKPPPLAEGPPGGKMQLPTDQEVDQALDYLERVYKKFRDHVKDLDKPQAPPGDSTPPTSPPLPPPKGSL